MPLDLLMADWRPGSYDPPWTWADEEQNLLTTVCRCCGKPGHYQLSLEEHLRSVGEVRQGVMLGNDGRVWDGHHRIVAAKRLGFTHVPLEDESFPDLAPQERAS